MPGSFLLWNAFEFDVDLHTNPTTLLEANRRAALVHGYPASELIETPAAHLMAEEPMPIIATIGQEVQQSQPTPGRRPLSGARHRLDDVSA